jgi:hypothetical protein
VRLALHPQALHQVRQPALPVQWRAPPLQAVALAGLPRANAPEAAPAEGEEAAEVPDVCRRRATE